MIEQEGRYEYKYIVDGEWMTNKYESLTPVNKDGHVNNYIQVLAIYNIYVYLQTNKILIASLLFQLFLLLMQVVGNDPESVDLWTRLGDDDFDLTDSERETIKRVLDEYPDDE